MDNSGLSRIATGERMRTYLTIEKAVEISSLSRSTLYALMEKGELAYTKVGRRRCIPSDAIEELMVKNTVLARAAN